MLRLIIAATIAYFLIPVELRPDFSAGSSKTVTSGEALSAAGSVIRDIGAFCERNPDACDTGKTLINNAKESVASGLEKLAEEEKTDGNIAEPETNTEILEKTD